MRQTRQRAAVLQMLRHSKQHPTAEMVYIEIQSSLPNISLATVYRLLNSLVDQGEVTELTMKDGPNRYDGTLGEHHHITCTICNQISDVPNLVSTQILQEIERWTNYSGVELKLGWSGTCSTCLNTNVT